MSHPFEGSEFGSGSEDTEEELREYEEEHSSESIPTPAPSPSIDLLATAINSPVPLAYGRHLVAGSPIFEHRLETTTPNKTILFIALGEGEWDSAEVVWVNGREIDLTDTDLFHFHPGKDGEEDGSFNPIVESDPPAAGNQKVCFFMPASFTRMTFSKTAYISLQLPDDPLAPGPAFDVRGIYKTRKVRIFDSSGNETSYAFSANPAWQLLDAFIALHLKPHGTADQALTAGEKARIDFAAFKTAADFCDVDIGGGIKRFESHVVFLSETNLATIFDTLLVLCRGYLVEQEGKLGLFIDKSRASEFTFNKSNVLASTFQAPEKPLRSLANRLVIKTRDIESGGGTASKDFAPWTKTLDDEAHQDRVGRIIKKDFDLGANTRERAERVGRYWLDRSLKLSEQGRLAASPDAGALLPGDRVLGPARTDFSQTRDWEVLEISDNPDGTRELFVQAYDETIFSDAAETQQGVEETTIPVGERWRRRYIEFPPDSDLRVHFSLDSGDGTAYGRGPDAVKIAGANVSAIEGISGKGIKCDTVNGVFDNGSEFVAGAANWTYAFWTNEGVGVEGSSRVMFKRSASDQIVSVSGGELGTFVGSFFGSGFLMSSLSAGQHHIAAVGHDSQTDFYVDGEFVGTASAKSVLGVQLIGNHSSGGSSWGAFDEVRIYNRALKPKEILALFQNPQGPQTQDNVPDGFDFGGVRNTALTGNEVDLAKAGVLNKIADNIAETAAKKWAAETGADITGGHTAALIAGQGALATQGSVDLATAEVTNKIADNISSTATKQYVNPTYVDGSLRPVTLRNAAVDIPAAQVFAKDVDDLDGVADGTTSKVVGQGTAFPGSPTANQFFYRTDTEELFQRNSGNTAWLLRAGRSLENSSDGTTANPTKADATPAVIPEMTITMTPKTTKVLVIFGCTFVVADSISGEWVVQLRVDGVDGGDPRKRTFRFDSTSSKIPFATSFLFTGLTAGSSVTFAAYWWRISGSGTIKALFNFRSIQAEDLI